MKKAKYLILFVLVLAIILTITLVINGNYVIQINGKLSSDQLKPVSKNIGSLTIMVDPRIELLSVVQYEAGYSHLTNYFYQYTEDVKEHIKPYKNLNAITEYQELDKLGFCFDAPPSFMLYLTNPPELKRKTDYSDYLIERCNGLNNLEVFAESLNVFSRETNFPEFYRSHIPLYEAMVNKVSNNLKEMDLLNSMVNYYGMEANSYQIVLSPLQLKGGYGPGIKGNNGLFDIYGILGPDIKYNELYDYNVPDFSVENIRNLVWHEFSHSFVNPTTEKYLSEVNQYDYLYDKIGMQMKSMAYPDWQVCVNEHIVRAITDRLTYLYQGQTEGDFLVNYDRDLGFIYIEDLCESLEIYEKHRDQYPTFESYYLQLIKVFRNYAQN